MLYLSSSLISSDVLLASSCSAEASIQQSHRCCFSHVDLRCHHFNCRAQLLLCCSAILQLCLLLLLLCAAVVSPGVQAPHSAYLTATTSTHLDDACTCCLCETQGAHTQLGHLEQTGIICHSSHQHSDLVLLHKHHNRVNTEGSNCGTQLLLAGRSCGYASVVYLAGHELGKLGQRQRRPVDLGHKQPLQHNLVEVAVCTPHQEAVELQEERRVRTSMARNSTSCCHCTSIQRATQRVQDDSLPSPGA